MTGDRLPTAAGRRRWFPLAVALLGLALVLAAGLRRLADGSADDVSHTLLLVGVLVAFVSAILSLRLARSRQSARESYEHPQDRP